MDTWANCRAEQSLERSNLFGMPKFSEILKYSNIFRWVLKVANRRNHRFFAVCPAFKLLPQNAFLPASFNRAASSLRRKNDFVFKQDCPIWAKVNIIWHVYLWIQFFCLETASPSHLKKNNCFVNFAKRIGKYKNYVSMFVEKKSHCFISQMHFCHIVSCTANNKCKMGWNPCWRSNLVFMHLRFHEFFWMNLRRYIVTLVPLPTKGVKSLSRAENLNFPPITVNNLFNFSAQESNLANFDGNRPKVKIPSDIKPPLWRSFK